MAMIRFKFLRIGEEFTFTENSQMVYTKIGIRLYSQGSVEDWIESNHREILSTDMLVYRVKEDK